MTAPQSTRAGTRQPYVDHREAALAILADCVIRGDTMPAKTASFLGASCAYQTLTPRMSKWLGDLLRKAGLPPIESR